MVHRHLEELKLQLNQQLTASEGKTKQELKMMKRAVESINVEKLESQTNEELIMVKKELGSLKEQLKETEKSSLLLDSSGCSRLPCLDISRLLVLDLILLCFSGLSIIVSGRNAEGEEKLQCSAGATR